ncbi:MAG: glycosyltransferase 87 family protein [archaeon]|nr:glycosyltransferase 87 family protein [archaeon]
MVRLNLLPDMSRRSILLFVVVIVAIGFTVRILGGLVFNYGYDVHHWAQVSAVISSGNGLYGLTGYFYTPVWGYILGLVDYLQQCCLTLGDTAYRVLGALCLEDEPGYISSNTTSLAYTFWIKLPLYVVDLVVAVLVYIVVRDYTGDGRKALLGFALWFLNPLVISSPMVQGMFDNIVALMVLLCVMLLMRSRYFGAGILLMLAILLKLFPFFLAPLLVAYVLVANGRSIRRALVPLVSAVAGALLTLVIILLPQFMDGTLEYCFTFITARSGGSDALSQALGLGSVAAYLLILLLSALIAWVFYRRADESDLDNELLLALIINLLVTFLYPPTPQYLVLFIPFLTIFVLVRDWGFARPLMGLSLAATLFLFSNGFTLLLTLATGTDLLSVETVVSLSESTAGVRMAVYYLAGVLQYLCILYLILRSFRSGHFDRFLRRKAPGIEP